MAKAKTLNITEVLNDTKRSAKGYSALNLPEGSTYSYSINKEGLVIKDSVTNKTLTLTNWTGIKTIQGNNVSSLSAINDTFNSGKRTYSGSNFGDIINAQTVPVKTDKKGKPTVTGVTIKTGNGNDEITGSKFNDTITGGAGNNTINYNAGQGNDKIYLSKNENLTLNIKDVSGNTISITDISYATVKNDLVITTKYQEDGVEKTSTLTLVNYGKKETGANVVINGKNLKEESELGVINAANYFQIEGKKDNLSYSGTALADEIDASGVTLYKKVKVGKKYEQREKEAADKGLSLNGGNGNDSIIGSKYSDTIKGGAGDDTIRGGKGNDVITGGTGANTIIYGKGDGNDIINLTKGEKFTLQMTGLTKDDLTYEFVNKNKDLRIYTSNPQADEYITIKNFGAKDVTNNSNPKKGIPDTGSVELQVGGETIDLRDAIVDGKYLYKKEVSTNYTGTWLNDEIDASGATLYKKVKVGKKYEQREKEAADKGLSLNGGNGNDSIIGSKYSDTIKGGAGDDIIEGGTGNDKLYGDGGYNTFIFNNGDGADTVFSGKGEDTLKFTNTLASDIKFERGNTRKNKYDLIIKYNHDTNGLAKDSVTIKNYFDKKGNPNNSVKDIVISGHKFNIEEFRSFDSILSNDGDINATSGNDIIIGSGNTYQYIYGNGGNDVIYEGSTGYSQIKCGDGDDTIYGLQYEDGSYFSSFTTGNGNNTVYCGASQYIFLGTGDDTVYLNGYSSVFVSGNINAQLSNKEGGNDTFCFSENAKGSIRLYGAMYDDLAVTRENGSDDLVINYGERSSVTLKDYYKSGNEDFGEFTIYAKKEESGNDLIDETVSYMIMDKGGVGDDIYYSNMTSGKIISDKGGNDILNIGSDKSDVKFIFNVKNDGSFAEGEDKLVFAYDYQFNNWMRGNTINGSVLTINDFDSIETIKTYDGYTITSAKLNVIKEQVANWLTSDGRNYGSVNDAITNKDENLSQLIQIYTDAGNWTAPTP